jgi:hypothetical protein
MAATAARLIDLKPDRFAIARPYVKETRQSAPDGVQTSHPGLSP